MKKIFLGKLIFLLISLIFILPKLVYGFFYYENLLSFNKDTFLIKLKNFENNIYLLCHWENLECQQIKETTAKINNYDYFSSPDFESFIIQIKIKNNFFNFYKNKDVVQPLNFANKINQVFFSTDKSKAILKSSNTYYLFDLNQNKIIKKLILNKKGSYLTFSPSLKYLTLYQTGGLTTYQKKFFIYNLENRSWKNFLKVKYNYWDLLTENNKIFEFLDDNNLIFLTDHKNFQKLYLYKINEDKIVDFLKENFIVKDFKIYQTKLFFTANRENPLK